MPGGAGMPGGGGASGGSSQGGGDGGSGDESGDGGGDFPADDSAGGGGDGSGEGDGGANPDPFGEGDDGGNGQGGDEEFEESLGDFDREMSREQEEIAREGGGPAADSTAQREGEDAEGGVPGDAAGGDAEGGNEAATIRDLGPDTAAVATVEGCNDPDRVARQLCEAATKEADPFLRAALWDEYNEYKKLVARD
jgi:hypothetical protein